MNETNSTRPRRLWPRFTLRVLLVFVTLVGVGLGYWTHRAREQRRIVERIEQGGGMVCYERDGPDAPEPRYFAVEWLAKVLSRDYLERVVSANVHDREIVRDLGRLRSLESLLITNDLSDDDVVALARCRNLHVLQIVNVDGTAVPKVQISDKSLHVISRLPKLQIARLNGQGFTREGIDALATSTTLRDLFIRHCDPSVTASDFDHLKRSGHLDVLNVWRVDSSGKSEEIVDW
jgi:hypothetical protein